jgi:hypothetical protein
MSDQPGRPQTSTPICVAMINRIAEDALDRVTPPKSLGSWESRRSGVVRAVRSRRFPQTVPISMTRGRAGTLAGSIRAGAPRVVAGK